MASLSLNKPKLIKRDRLFFDKYHYCVGFYMKELHVCRGADHDRVNTWIDARQGWFNDYRNKNHGGSWHNVMGGIEPVPDQVRHNCHIMVEFLKEHKDQHKLMISCNWGWFYTNDLATVKELSKLDFVDPLNFTQATVTIPRGAIRIVSSPNKFRSYFRSTKLTQEQKTNLQNFVENNPEIRCSPALSKWLNRETSPYWRWCRDSYFIDYNSEYILTMLGLICHNVIRKTLNIVNDK